MSQSATTSYVLRLTLFDTAMVGWPVYRLWRRTSR